MVREFSSMASEGKPEYDLVIATESGVKEARELPPCPPLYLARVIAPAVHAKAGGASGGIVVVGLRELVRGARLISGSADGTGHRVATLQWAADKRARNSNVELNMNVTVAYAPTHSQKRGQSTLQHTFFSEVLPNHLNNEARIKRNDINILCGDLNNVTNADRQEWKENHLGERVDEPLAAPRSIARGALRALMASFDYINPMESTDYTTHGKTCSTPVDATVKHVVRRALDHVLVANEWRSCIRNPRVVPRLELPLLSDHDAIEFELANLTEIKSYAGEGRRMRKHKLSAMNEQSWVSLGAGMAESQNLCELTHNVQTLLHRRDICGTSSDRVPYNWNNELTGVRGARHAKNKVRLLASQLRREVRSRMYIPSGLVVIRGRWLVKLWAIGELLRKQDTSAATTATLLVANMPSWNVANEAHEAQVTIPVPEAAATLNFWEQTATEADKEYHKVYTNYTMCSVEHYLKAYRAARWTNPKRFYKWLRGTWGTRDTGPAVLRGRQGVSTTTQDVFSTIEEYYSKLGSLDRDETLTENARLSSLPAVVRNRAPEISEKEVAWALTRLAKEKAPGIDGIPNEIWKGHSERLVSILPKMFSEVLRGEAVPPSEWATAPVRLLFKKGDVLDIANYRPIALQCTLAKIYTSILTQRLRNELEANNKLSSTQCGFRVCRSAETAAAALTTVLSVRRRQRQSTRVLLLDVRKAFDRVHRGAVWTALAQKGVSPPLIAAIREMYTATDSQFITHFGLTPPV
ncbi:reverse transcriptase domain-containing protein, partial [Herbaspirillum sp.]|uniref:reverse transcriptase domain-containing protein n=1 Tax=Herbaspirillum sp. TaxID=1890675 RepID=UPI0025900AA4